jgi:diguanylate cyclase (GGDEF)-like protein
LWASGALALAGSPPVQRFVPESNGYPQYMAIAEDAVGRVVVGAIDGLLLHDGARWQSLPLPNHDLVRSLATVAGRVYVGGYDSFGVLTEDPTGQPHYRELSSAIRAKLNRDFADVWDIVDAPEGVYFRALNDLFCYSPADGSIRHWHHAGRFGALGRHGSDTLIQFRGEGFKRRVGNDWQLLPATAMLTRPAFVLITRQAGGSVLGDIDGNWWTLDADAALKPLVGVAGLPTASEIVEGVELSDRTLAMVSAGGELSIVDLERARTRRFALGGGYLTRVQESRFGGLIALGTLKIHRVRWPSPWTVIAASELRSSITALGQWGADTYVLTDNGVNRVALGDDGLSRFDPLDWTESATHALEPIDGDRALLAEAYDLALIERGRRQTLEALRYPRTFLRDRFRTNRLWIGTENGLAALDLRTLKLSAVDPTQTGVGVLSIAQVDATTLIVGTPRDGAWRIDVRGAAFSATALTDGIAYGMRRSATVQRAGETVTISTARGLYRWTGGKLGIDPRPLPSAEHPEDPLTLKRFGSIEVAFSARRLWLKRGNQEWQPQPLEGFHSGALLDVRAEADGRLVVVSNDALVLLDPLLTAPAAAPLAVRFARIERIEPNGESTLLPLQPAAPIEISPPALGIGFTFALPGLHPVGSVQYRGQLKPFESEMSEWASATGYSYTQLRAGRYAMRVEARGPDGVVSSSAEYAIVVLPRWYQRRALLVVALLGLLALAVATGFALVRRRTRRLEAIVAERTRALNEANLRLDAMAHLDALTGLPNRRRLDAFLETLWARLRRDGQSLAVLVIDIDHFKRYNDSFGHSRGDQALRAVAQTLRATLERDADLLARYGGEEFLLLIGAGDTALAARTAEALRAAVESATEVTISVGYAVSEPSDRTAQVVIDRADQALYRAKRAGRNRVAG